MAASSTTSTDRPSSSSGRLEVEQQPVDRAGVGEAFVGQADGGDPGRGGAEDLMAVQLEGLPGQPQRPGLARPARPTTTPRRRPPRVRSRTMAAWSSPAVAWRSKTWRTTSGRTTAQPSPVRPVAPSTSCRSSASSSGVENRSTPSRRSRRPRRPARPGTGRRRLGLGERLLGQGATGSRLARASTTSVRVKVDTCPVSPSGPDRASRAASSSVRVAGRPRPPEQTSASCRSPCSASSPPTGHRPRLGLAVVLGRPGRHRRGAGRLDPGQAVASSHWSICSERLENRSISVRSSRPTISAALSARPPVPSGPPAVG